MGGKSEVKTVVPPLPARAQGVLQAGLMPKLLMGDVGYVVVEWVTLYFCLPPKSDIHLESANVTVCGERVFADVVKDFEMRSFWIKVHPQSND